MKSCQSVSFVRALVLSLAGLVAASGIALIGGLVWQGVSSTREASQREINETLSRGMERLRMLAGAVEMTTESADRAARNIGVSSATLRPVLEASLAAFEQRPELSYLGLGLEKTGEYGCLERTPSGEIRMRLFPGDSNDTDKSRDYLLTKSGFVFQGESPAKGFDPRIRPYYVPAVNGPEKGTWIPGYEWLIHSGGEDSLWGFSYAKALRDENGRVAGVLDIDFDMMALKQFLDGITTDYDCTFRVVELGGVARMIGGPEVGGSPVAPPSWMAPLLKREGDGAVTRMKIGDAQTWVAAGRLTLQGGASWLVVASRTDSFIGGPLRHQLYIMTGMCLVIAAVLLLVSMRIARRFGRPLMELEAQMAKFARNDPTAFDVTASAAIGGFRETRMLDQTFRRMAASVRQREQELFTQNTRLRSHLENTPLAVVEWDARLRITNVNASAVRLFRCAEGELAGRPVTELIAPEERSQVAPVFDPAGAGEGARQFSAKACAAGASPDCEWYVTRLAADAAGHWGGCALVLDVSQLLEAKAAFRAADARFRVLFDESPAAHCLLRESDGAVVALNVAAEKLLGITQPAARDKTLAELGVTVEIHHETRVRDAVSDRVTLRTPAGRERHCLVADSQVELAGDPCRLWVAIDITAEIQALEQKATLEARLSRQRDALISHTEHRREDGDMEAFLRSMTESSAVTLGVARVSAWLYSADQSRMECRDLFEGGTGRHTAGTELSARDYPIYFRTLAGGEIIAVDDTEADLRTHEFVASYFRPHGIGAMLDVPLYRGGKVVGVLCHEHVGRSREWAADERSFAMAMANLVSLALEGAERRLLQEQFLRAQRLEAVGTLASGLAHDLNNILAPMLMAAALLKAKLTAPGDQKMVAMIESGAERGGGIIRQLLTFGRGAGGERASVQLRHLVRDISHIVKETFPKSVEFASALPSRLWPVENADVTQLHQVLLNLCVNARDAMPRGGRLSIAAENVRLEAGAEALPAAAPPGPYVRLTIADTGEGIPHEVIERIFDPFFTTKAVGKGTGLGLSSVLSIVKGHGGFLKVDSTPGAGTTFVIHLPAVEADAGAAGDESADELPRGDGELVLLVDDEGPMRQTVREILELHGYRVITAGNGEEAVRRFVENREVVRVVLTDMEMPVMNGIDLIHSLRILQSGLRFVVLSGSIVEERREELVRMGIDTILPKPCDAGHLLNTLHQVLSAR